jgi:pimeloyl-ACP methyl ester carboxylesterase
MKLKQRLGITYIQTKIKLTALVKKKKAAEQAFQLFCTPFAKTKRKEEPKNAEALQFTLNNKTVKGHRWNHPPTGPCGQQKKALILHGFSSSAHKFDRYVAPLIKKGYEVLSFDAPAHGDSEGTTTNAVEYSDMIKKVMELYGPINSFIAHSFGGIALSLAMENIPHDEQTKIVFIAPATETTSAVDGAFAMLDIKDKAVRKEFDQLIFEMSGHNTEWFSIRRAVNNIPAQILWIHDEDDDITPLSDALKVKADNHSNINFVITKGLGHRKIYHDAEVKKAIINFM